MGVRSRSKLKRRRRATTTVSVVDDGVTGGDLISGLTDDLLLRILDLLPDTRDAVRTDALSRRWRGLWTGVAAVRFDFDFDYDYYCVPEVCGAAAGATERYLAFVNGALALRASRRRHAVKDLAICFDISGHRTHDDDEELGPPAFFHTAQGWIRYVVQNQVESFILDLHVPWNYTKRPVMMAIDELATSAKLETMHLKLGYAAQLGLSSSSSTVLVFASLTDLSLEDMTVGSGDLLSRLVSSPCCPRQRKLRLSDLRFISAIMDHQELLLLIIESHTLLELSMEMMDMVPHLQLRTPSLRVLRVDLDRFKVSSSAPRRLEAADLLPSVATLKTNLSSHAGFDNIDGSFDLLKCCRSTRSLEVSLDVVEHRKGDIIKEGRIPPLPHVTSLTLDVTLREPHFFGSGIGSFLAQCSGIRYLRLQLWYCIMKKDLLEQNLSCENSCQWKSHDDFSLAHLQEIEFDELIGTDCELQFIQSILKRGTGVQKIQISFDPDYWLKNNNDSFKLVLPSLDGGSWTTCNDDNLSYKWRRYCV